MLLVPSPRWLGPQLPRCPLLLAQTGTIGFTRKEDNQRYFTVYTKERGNSVPKGLNISPSNNKHYIQYAWQPSLVLGDLGRARHGPYSPQGL